MCVVRYCFILYSLLISCVLFVIALYCTAATGKPATAASSTGGVSAATPAIKLCLEPPLVMSGDACREIFKLLAGAEVETDVNKLLVGNVRSTSSEFGSVDDRYNTIHNSSSRQISISPWEVMSPYLHQSNNTHIYKLIIKSRSDCHLHQTVDLAKCRINTSPLKPFR